MAATHEDNTNIDEVAEEQFIMADDVLEIVSDDGDQPMDDDDDDLRYRDRTDDEDLNAGNVVWEDNSIRHFSEHRKSVFSVALHPTQPLCASGGQDDMGYIWDITSGERITKLTGHTDSVSATGFSPDGELVSTGGMDGKVRIWKRRGTEDYRTWEFLTEMQGPDEVMVRFVTRV